MIDSEQEQIDREVAETEAALVGHQGLSGTPAEHQVLDRFEDHLLDNPQVIPIHMPVVHRFTEGLYSREIFMPGPHQEMTANGPVQVSGVHLTSKCHMTDHQYVVLAGAVEVAIPGQEPVVLTAGHVGITRTGTRRALRVLEDCRWVTFHPLSPEEEEARADGASDEEMLEMIQHRIIGNRQRPDGRDVHAEYTAKLTALGLPGPNSGAHPLLEAE